MKVAGWHLSISIANIWTICKSQKSKFSEEKKIGFRSLHLKGLKSGLKDHAFGNEKVPQLKKVEERFFTTKFTNNVRSGGAQSSNVTTLFWWVPISIFVLNLNMIILHFCT